MHFTKQYRMYEKSIERGLCECIISETITTGLWIFEVPNNNEEVSIYAVAEVASNILCGKYPVLEDEAISQLRVEMKLGEKALQFTFDKGYSKLRILEEIAKNILVN